MFRTIGCLGITGLLCLAGCGNDEEQTPPPAPTAAAEPAQPTAPPAAEPAQPQGGANLESNFGTVSLEPGFVPDPKVVSGTSGGDIDASTLNAACTGWVTETPDHILATSGDFSSLRVMAHSAGDITLVVQKPDGTYACDDDTEGTDPVVEAAMQQGNYKIWIGSYEQGANAQYQLGFSELPSVMPSGLGG